jgi:two-component system NarL family response regulator
MTGRPSQHLIELTDKQTEVLSHVAKGLDQPQISKVMQVSVNTVRGHLREALERLGAKNGANAASIAIGLGILPADIALITTLRGDSRVR